MEPCREGVAISIGDDMPAMSRSPNESVKSGKVESSKSEPKSVESTRELTPPAKLLDGLRYHEKSRSFSLSDFRRYAASKPLGVPIGVVSAVDARSTSLVAGEKCKGGGVSRESSLPACCDE